jgi:tRNA dimethylallyltransferase
MKSPCAILIAGPTASGKSRLALALAERLGGTVINADSMQVYRELRILTARPSAADEARAPHALYGFVPVREVYSAGRYMADATRAIGEARAAGLRPIIVGGTGLYFKALLEGLAPIPAIREEVRAHWRGEAARLGAAVLHGELARRDPAGAARLRPTDTQRIVRALEVIEATGRPLADWQRLPGSPVLACEETVRLLVSLERTELYRRCDLRFEAMLAAGALEEASALQQLGLAAELPGMSAVGLRPLLAHLSGRLTLEEAVSQAKGQTRKYAKRQLTWLRRNMISWRTIDAQELERNGGIDRIFSELRD